jgi:hypothetical protein
MISFYLCLFVAQSFKLIHVVVSCYNILFRLVLSFNKRASLLILGRGVDPSLYSCRGELLSQLVELAKESIFASRIRLTVPLFFVPLERSALTRVRHIKHSSQFDQVGRWVNVQRDQAVYELLGRRSLESIVLGQHKLD